MATKPKKYRHETIAQYDIAAEKLCKALREYEPFLMGLQSILHDHMNAYKQDLLSVAAEAAGLHDELPSEEWIEGWKGNNPMIKAAKRCTHAINAFSSHVEWRLDNLDEVTNGKKMDPDVPLESRVFLSFPERTVSNIEKMKLAKKECQAGIRTIHKVLGSTTRFLLRTSASLPLPYSEYAAKGTDWQGQASKFIDWKDRRPFLEQHFPKLQRAPT